MSMTKNSESTHSHDRCIVHPNGCRESRLTHERKTSKVATVEPDTVSIPPERLPESGIGMSVACGEGSTQVRIDRDRK